MENELRDFAIKRERSKSKHDRYAEFEHCLRYMLCDFRTDREDSFLLDDVKQTVIVFLMKKEYEETNETFLDNMKSNFYRALDKLETRHNEIKERTWVIKLFMEDFYFNM